jgi:hypothetical protein
MAATNSIASRTLPSLLQQAKEFGAHDAARQRADEEHRRPEHDPGHRPGREGGDDGDHRGRQELRAEPLREKPAEGEAGGQDGDLQRSSAGEAQHEPDGQDTQPTHIHRHSSAGRWSTRRCRPEV